MADEIIRFIDHDEVVRARDRYLDEAIKPQVGAFFEKYPAIHSATLSASQYYNDQALDEMHCRWQMFEDAVSVIVYDPDRKFGSSVGTHAALGLELVRQPEFASRWSGIYWCAPLFASACPDGVVDAYEVPGGEDLFTPIAHFHRTTDGVDRSTIDISSKRPWLDGVAAARSIDLHRSTPSQSQSEFYEWLDWVCRQEVDWPDDARSSLSEVHARFEDLRFLLTDDDQLSFFDEVVRPDLEVLEKNGPRARPLSRIDPISKRQPSYVRTISLEGPQFNAWQKAWESYDSTERFFPIPLAARCI